MPKANRLSLAVVSVAAIVSLAGVAEAGRRHGRPNNSTATAADKFQPIVDRTNAMIGFQVARFNNEVSDLADELAELAAEVDNNTPEDEILDFAFDFEDELLEEEFKAGFKIDRVADRSIMRLTILGADPSYGLVIETTRTNAQAEVSASVMALLSELDLAVENALAIAAQPDDIGGSDDDDDDDDDDGGCNGSSDDNDDDNDDDD